MTSRNHRKRCQSQNTTPTNPEKETRADRHSHEAEKARTGASDVLLQALPLPAPLRPRLQSRALRLEVRQPKRREC
jgi:hypothetical protein